MVLRVPTISGTRIPVTDGILTNFEWFDEKTILSVFLTDAIRCKGISGNLVISPVTEEEALHLLPPAARDALDVIQLVIGFFNDIAPEWSNEPELGQRRVKRFLADMQKEPLVYANAQGSLLMFMTRIWEQRRLPTGVSAGFHRIAEYLLYLPILLQQAKKRKIVTGVNHETGKLIFSNQIRLLHASPSFLAKNDIMRVSGRDVQGYLAFNTHRFLIRAMGYVWWLFDETCQDLLPDIWTDGHLMKRRNLPHIYQESWREQVIEAGKHRHYVLPEEGYLVDCSHAGFGDVRTISFKESYQTGFVYAKISFADDTDDIVLFNAGHRATEFYSGCWGLPPDDIRKGQNPLMKMVAKVYADSISNRRILIRNPLEQEGERKPSIKGLNAEEKEVSSGVIYIPRTMYEGQRVSEVRHRVGTEITKAPHAVVGHLRRGNASEKSKAEAAKYGIHLPDGFTFVRPYHTGNAPSEKQKAIVRPV